MDTTGGKWRGGGDGVVMNWAVGFNMYTLMCIKFMTNKNLLYKKIKFKNSKKNTYMHSSFHCSTIYNRQDTEVT